MGKILFLLIFTFLMLRATALLPDEFIHTPEKQELLEIIQKDYPEYILNDISVIENSLWFVVGAAENDVTIDSSVVSMCSLLRMTCRLFVIFGNEVTKNLDSAKQSKNLMADYNSNIHNDTFFSLDNDWISDRNIETKIKGSDVVRNSVKTN